MAKKTTTPKKPAAEKKAPAKKPAAKKPEGPKKSSLKGTDSFTQAIKQHLMDYARKDHLFLKSLQKPNKNLDDCITYILNHVKKSGMVAYAEEEIYKLARHYYDEDDVKPGDPVTNGEIIMNHAQEITEEDKAKAKAEAVERLVKEEMVRMRKKNTPPSKSAELAAKAKDLTGQRDKLKKEKEAKKEEPAPPTDGQMSMF